VKQITLFFIPHGCVVFLSCVSQTPLINLPLPAEAISLCAVSPGIIEITMEDGPVEYGKQQHYEMDFSPLTREGNYMISVHGVGCSFPFSIAGNVRKEKYIQAAIQACLTGAGATPLNICYTPVFGMRQPLNIFHADARISTRRLQGGLQSKAAGMFSGFRPSGSSRFMHQWHRNMRGDTLCALNVEFDTQ
jgi:hypothetical protein